MHAGNWFGANAGHQNIILKLGFVIPAEGKDRRFGTLLFLFIKIT